MKIKLSLIFYNVATLETIKKINASGIDSKSAFLKEKEFLSRTAEKNHTNLTKLIQTQHYPFKKPSNTNSVCKANPSKITHPFSFQSVNSPSPILSKSHKSTNIRQSTKDHSSLPSTDSPKPPSPSPTFQIPIQSTSPDQVDDMFSSIRCYFQNSNFLISKSPIDSVSPSMQSSLHSS